jgi:hypothetical protein
MKRVKRTPIASKDASLSRLTECSSAVLAQTLAEKTCQSLHRLRDTGDLAATSVARIKAEGSISLMTTTSIIYVNPPATPRGKPADDESADRTK